MHLDAMAFGAHVDDIELSCAGTLIKLIGRGHKVGACELSAGELSTRGTPEIREREAAAAAEIMGLAVRENLGIPDGDIVNNFENRLKVIEVVRKHRPDIVFANYWDDRHPDHSSASRLVTEACFYSGLRGIETGDEPFRPRLIAYYQLRDEFEPSFLVDISEQFEKKMEAIFAHKTQFHDPESKEPETFISSKYFMDSLVKRMEYYGLRIGARYAEPFYIKQYIGIDDPVEFFRAFDANRIMSTPVSRR